MKKRPDNLLGLSSGHSRLKRLRAKEICKIFSKGRKLRILDAFAGLGMLTDTYSIYASEVIAIEKDRTVFKTLEKKLGKRNNVKLYNNDNLCILEMLVEDAERFDIIDLDPFDNSFYQIPLATKLIKDGLMFITSGEVLALRRGGMLKRYGGVLKSGDIDKLPNVILGYIAKYTIAPVRLLECYIGRTALRMYVKVGLPDLPRSLNFTGVVKHYKERPEIIDMF